MVGPGLRLVENSTRLLPSQFGHVFLPGEELRLLVGLTYRVCRTRLRRSDDGVGLRLRAFQTSFRLTHQRRGAFQLHRHHFLQLVELFGEFVAVDAHAAGEEQYRFRFVQCRFEFVDNVVHGGEFVAAQIVGIVQRRVGIERVA